MSIGIVSAAYIAAAVLFILSAGRSVRAGKRQARGLVRHRRHGASPWWPRSSGPDVANCGWIIAVMVAVGSVAGWIVAKRVQMTEMPQLVAALHSFVGLAAVFIGFNADIELGRVLAMDEAAKADLIGFAAMLAHKDAVELAILQVEVFLGVFIGAVTFTGSVVAFGKLAGKVDGKAKKLPGGHLLNAGAAAAVGRAGACFTSTMRAPGRWS